MHRREFLIKTSVFTGGLMSAAANAAQSEIGSTSSRSGIHWKREASSRLFSSVVWGDEPLAAAGAPGPLDGLCRIIDGSNEPVARLTPSRSTARCGPLQVRLHHRLHDTGAGLGEDLLEATLEAHNDSGEACQVELAFLTSVEPGASAGHQRAYLPLNAAGLSGDRRFTALGVKGFLKDCSQVIDSGEFVCHYLEPGASYPDEQKTVAQLLAPVVDLHSAGQPLHVALFTPSDQPMKFQASLTAEGHRVWRTSRVVDVPAGTTRTLRCWLMLHIGNASAAWRVFHRFAHREDHPPIDWIREFKVHYYDFLSSADGRDGHRGDGYEAAVPLFRQFHVGLATQHGYYPTLGDYIHPDRKTWLAMRGDKQGPAEMSFDRIKERLRSTRAAGAKAAIYLHPVLFDDVTPFYEKMQDSVLVGADGERVPFPWQGPDTVGKNWRASLASPEWRAHLLQQAEWIMEILQPDAITVDETFAGIGYDHHPDHAGPTSAAAIDWHRKLRALVRAYGPDRAVFTSDCSMSPFVLWADGEVGDHAYPGSLGNPLYRQEPVRYLAALGDKPWRPCAWHFTRMWDLQMKLARQVGAGVGVANGWLEYTGLHGLSAEQRRRLIRDIESLL